MQVPYEIPVAKPLVVSVVQLDPEKTWMTGVSGPKSFPQAVHRVAPEEAHQMEETERPAPGVSVGAPPELGKDSKNPPSPVSAPASQAALALQATEVSTPR